MKKVSAIIEMASDGNYSIYMDADDMDYLVTATGATSKEAIEDFKKGMRILNHHTNVMESLLKKLSLNLSMTWLLFSLITHRLFLLLDYLGLQESTRVS